MNLFQSTPSAWRETRNVTCYYWQRISFQSTPSAWRETRIYNVDFYILPLFQSTPSAWRETMRTITSPNNKHISINSLLMEVAIMLDCKHTAVFVFQSTPSAWRETLGSRISVDRTNISIHSLRMEGDATIAFARDLCLLFQSTPSAWRETDYDHTLYPDSYISIHSLRMEGDQFVLLFRDIRNIHFNPLPPHGGRLLSAVFMTILSVFQSTPSAWRETVLVEVSLTRIPFQSTPSAWRETNCAVFRRFLLSLFQSTPSAWRETNACFRCGNAFRISIHSLRMEGDRCSRRSQTVLRHFNPLPPHGGRRW